MDAQAGNNPDRGDEQCSVQRRNLAGIHGAKIQGAKIQGAKIQGAKIQGAKRRHRVAGDSAGGATEDDRRDADPEKPGAWFRFPAHFRLRVCSRCVDIAAGLYPHHAARAALCCNPVSRSAKRLFASRPYAFSFASFPQFFVNHTRIREPISSAAPLTSGNRFETEASIKRNSLETGAHDKTAHRN
ncbi:MULTISPECIES: hypothetical protein [unclassified Mesorhizobium]|uniref:hypothetical protein n=1 Tax=unclassified Mesorhizobium TaxID=325217 RepID=UPI00167625AC|nr:MULTISPECIES: hypothetical protein [unclassified Mesorhizobium]